MYKLAENSVQALSGAITSSICIKEGSALNYECTVNDKLGIGSTIWQGDAFKCIETANQITLLHTALHHRQFKCGNFSALIVSVNRSEYTSRLTFFGDDYQLNGTTINCTLSGIILVKSIFVKVRG